MTLASLGLAAIGSCSPNHSQMALTDDLRAQCYDTLMHAIQDPSPFVRVHAAEALVAFHRAEPALATFRPERDTSEPEYRIVVWRVLAAAEPEPAKRREYVERIRSSLLDPNSPDPTHAMESLAKLSERATGDAERHAIHSIADAAGPSAPFALWRLAQSEETGVVDRLARLLKSKDTITRLRAIYVLGRLQLKLPAAREALLSALATEPSDSSLLATFRAAVGGEAGRAVIRDLASPPGDRYFAAMFLADSGSPADYPILCEQLKDANSDLRVSAAYAMLNIDARSKTRADK